jgi:tRNA(Ile)-lysidine synthase
VTLPPALGPALEAAPAGEIGVAVSGGGDSVALMLLLHAAAAGRPVAAVTVDHGLREASAAEAAAVGALCAARGIPHEVRPWTGWDGGGNLQARARQARRRLIAEWARGRGIGAVALGHTLDDQAETFVMRLARGSGVDGLSGMAAVTAAEGILWLRPLLGVRRAELRRWLMAEGVAWAEDPSNADARFDRVRARAALPALEALGLGADRLAATAGRMARAREALEQATAELARASLTTGDAGDLTLEAAPLRSAAAELRLRLLAGALCWVSGAAYRPRLVRLEAALAAVEAGAVGHGITLHGCVLRARGGRVTVRREPARVAPPVPLARGRWDGRWQVVGQPPVGDDLTIGALGLPGLAACPDWRATGLAREALLTTPAIWRGGGALVAAPLVRPAAGFGFRRVSAVAPPWAPEILR